MLKGGRDFNIENIFFYFSIMIWLCHYHSKQIYVLKYDCDSTTICGIETRDSRDSVCRNTGLVIGYQLFLKNLLISPFNNRHLLCKKFYYWKLSGILRDKTMEDKLIYIPNNDKQNLPLYCWLKRFKHY